MTDYNLILNEHVINGDKILKYRKLQCVVIMQFWKWRWFENEVSAYRQMFWLHVYDNLRDSGSPKLGVSAVTA